MSDDLTKQSQSAIARTKARGLEEPTQQEDLIIPRAKLLQALSPECVEGKEGCTPGVIINSVTKERMPVDPKGGHLFVPVIKNTNWIRFNPRNSKDLNYNPEFGPGDMVWRSNDPLDPRVKAEGRFGPNGERPAATKFLNFLSYFPGVNMPIVVSFSNTSYKAGKELLSIAQFAEVDLFARRYRLRSRQESNDMGTYFVLTVEQAGASSDEEFKLCEGLWEQFHARDYVVHDEKPEENDSSNPLF